MCRQSKFDLIPEYRTMLAELNMKLAGAVCDFTEPATGQHKLFFPVE